MQVIADPQKDVCRVETYLKTDIAAITLWDSQLKDDGKIAVETGSDGNFKTIINI